MRASVVAFGLVSYVGLGACAAPPGVRLELPPEATAPAIHTLVVSLEHEGARTTLLIDRDAPLPELPSITEWDEDPAVYTVLAFARTVAELDVVAGPVTPAEGPFAVTLPAPDQTFRAELSVKPPTAWVAGAPVPPVLASLQLPRATQPVDCSTTLARSLAFGSNTTNITRVVATSPDTALVVTVQPGGVSGLAEVLPSGPAEDRPLPAEVDRLVSLATDGTHVWATDLSDRVVLLDLHGGVLAHGAPGALDGVIASPDGVRVFGWKGTRVVTLVAGSTRTVDYPTGPGGPPSIDRLGPSPTGDLLVASRGDLWVWNGRAWKNEFRPPDDFGALGPVAADEVGYYAATAARLFERRIEEPSWHEITDIGTFERNHLISFGQGRRAVAGVGGFIEVWPNRPPYQSWCLVNAGTLREIEGISVDPTRRTLFAIDGLDGDGSEPGPLILRVSLPK